MTSNRATLNEDGTLSLPIPTPSVHERIEYNIYEGDKVIATGENPGYSFTSLGKHRIAQMVADGGVATNFLNYYRVYLLDHDTWFSSAMTVCSFYTDEGKITAQTQEFVSAGNYVRIQGGRTTDAGVNSYYHYITTNVTIGTGQTVKFFVEYDFNGLGSEGGAYPSVNGDTMCAAMLCNYTVGANALFVLELGAIEIEFHNGTKTSIFPLIATDSTTHDNGGYILISGHQFTLADNASTHYIRVLNSNAQPLSRHVFHEWGYLQQGDNTGPVSINNNTGATVTIQADMEFEFDW